MPSANPEPAPLQPIVSDDEDVQEKSQTKSQNRNLRKSRMRNQWEARKELTPTLTQGRLCHIQSCMGRTLAVRKCDHLHPLLHGPPALYRYTASGLTSWDLHASEDTSEDSDAIIEALDDRLVQLQDVVDLNDSALGRLHGRVTAGEIRLTAVEQEAVAARQRDARTSERLDSFAALTIVNMMLLAFVLLRGWFS
ncbi:hypothetical protein L1987_15434 [Smallanthus sonchifolius]|uniref:Uncharacterized protein n=1 Tax=Smallanthus sonchifolius TaxID=185202 RepID=A0ACB9J5L2_9ASTR|nr:hypothetical protein L1987_15434 [Smallanthus sonchifolius]